MTLTERLTFEDQLDALADTFRAKLTDRTRDRYFEHLNDLALPVLVSAMQRAGRDGDKFPVPKTLRQLAQCEARKARDSQTKRAQAQMIEAGVDAPGPHCDACDDYGWIYMKVYPSIYGGEVEVSQVRRCACWATNPVKLARETLG